MRLARAVRADQPDALAEVDLVLEREDEPVDRDVVQRDDPARRVAAAQAHADRLVDDRRGRRALVDPAAPARLHRVRALGPVGRVLRALLEDAHELAQPALLVVPALEPVAHELPAVLARLGVRRVGPAVHPGAVALERDDRVAGGAEQHPVVADQQDGLLRRARSAARAPAWRGRRGSCRARRAAGSRRRSGTASRARAACARRRTASRRRGRRPPRARRRRCAGRPRPRRPRACSRRAPTSRRSPRRAARPPPRRRRRARARPSSIARPASATRAGADGQQQLADRALAGADVLRHVERAAVER